MIPFDAAKLETKHMMVKMVSGALGGTLTVLDPKRSKKAKKEVFTKIKIPHNLTRHFAKKYRVTKYIQPVLTAVTFYEGHIVCIERHPLGNLGRETTEGLFGEVKWEGDSEKNIEKLLKPLSTGQEWYIDGSYIYNVSKKELAIAEPLSADGKFRQVKVQAIKLCNLADLPTPEERVCLAFYPSDGLMSITPPIWKTLTNIGHRQISAKGSTTHEDDDEREEGVSYIATERQVERQQTQFDDIDQHLCVNLNFALKAGRELSEVFGYDSIEPLGLDDMMIQLRTVNLPNIAMEVKQTFDTGLSFTIAIAWLIGMTRRVETLDAYITLRSLLKYLTTKGVYRKGAFDAESIFKQGQTMNDVKMLTKDEAKARIGTLGIDAFLQANRVAREISGDSAVDTGLVE